MVRPYPLRLTEQVSDASGAPSLISRVLRKSLPGGNDGPSVAILGHPDQRVTTGPFAGTTLPRLAAAHPEWLGGDSGITHRASFEDHGGGTSVQVTGSILICHILWCAEERSAYVLAGIDPAASERKENETGADHLIRRPVSPGDTLVIPARMPHAFGPGILACHVSVLTTPDRDAPVPGPTHGLSRFEGFNRRTICAAGPGFILERWKITQPLRLHRGDARWMFMTNLVEPVALTWDGGSELVGRAESRLLPALLQTCTLIPDGIAYVLCGYVPDLVSDVVAPLRLAGYRDDEIAILGNMRPALGAAR